MASTYTAAGIELITTGEQSGTWGTTTNTNLELIEELAVGVVSIALSGTTYTLTTSDGVSSEGRHAVVVFSGSPGGTCTVTISPNDMQKVYFVKNGSDETVTLTQGSGGNVSVASGKSAIVYCDGAGASAAVVDLTSTFVPPGALLAANNLSDVANAATARANLSAIGGITATLTHGVVGDGTNFISTSASTDALLMPAGTTAQQPGSPANGMIRYNTDDDQFEGYAGGAWGAIAGSGGSGGGGSILVNQDNVTESYTIASGSNGFSVGPVTVDSGVTVTVSSGQRWVVI